MNEQWTPRHRATIEVVGYADGVYNLRILNDEGDEEMVNLSTSEAERVATLFGADLPEPEPRPTERWG